mgnify:CR=1 FL=1
MFECLKLEHTTLCDRLQYRRWSNLMWGCLLLSGWLVSRLICLCGLPSDCVNIEIKDIEYLFVYGYVAGVIINIDSDRGNVLRRWWFWLIYILTGVIFSTIGEIKAMQWSVTQGVTWTPYMIGTISVGSVMILSLFFQIALYYRNIQYCITIGLIYIVRAIQIVLALSVPKDKELILELPPKHIHYILHSKLEIHHYWLAWNIILLCSITNSLYNDILLAVFTSIFVQGVSVYGSAPVVNYENKSIKIL